MRYWKYAVSLHGWRVGFCMLSVTLNACVDREQREKGVPSLTQEHGVHVGMRLDLKSVVCADERGLAPTSESPVLLTFASPADCALCQSHLSALDSLQRLGRIPVESRVIYGTATQSADVAASALQVATSATLCRDVGNEIWRTAEVSRTPFSALHDGERVLYMNDRLLNNAQEVAALLAELSSISRASVADTMRSVPRS